MSRYLTIQMIKNIGLFLSGENIKFDTMAEIKKNKSKSIQAGKKTRSTPLLLPRYPAEAKKLAEVNAILEKAVLLPHHGKQI